jgi:hypothetical protein
MTAGSILASLFRCQRYRQAVVKREGFPVTSEVPSTLKAE